MLFIASRTIQRFLLATVPPPAADARPEDWVRLGDVAEPADESNSDTLVIQLYCIEPSPFVRYEPSDRSGAAPSNAALLLDLHYAVTYMGHHQEVLERALGGVLRAFQTQSTLNPRDYLVPSEQERASAEGLSLSRIEMSLESQHAVQAEQGWPPSGRANGLTLYYKACSVRVPAFVHLSTPSVHSVVPPAPSILHPRDNGGGS